MKLYHLTKDLKHDGIFTPRIPQKRYRNEDAEIERICFSSSIEGALSAIPVPSGESFSELNQSFGCVWKVFEVDTTKLNPAKIQSPQKLYESGQVLDAWLTQEYWVTERLDLSSSSYFVLIDNFEDLELSSEEQKLELSQLNWRINSRDLFGLGDYQVFISLEHDDLAVKPDSFEFSSREVIIPYWETVKPYLSQLQSFCNNQDGISMNSESLEDGLIHLVIEHNQALQSVCNYIGTQWFPWEALCDLY